MISRYRRKTPFVIPAEVRRGRRVTILLAAVILFSTLDLAITLTHLFSIGMIEANPIAAYVIDGSASGWNLALYKLGTVGICVGLLFQHRRLIQAEFAAWIAVIILTAMAVQWSIYTRDIDGVAAMAISREPIQDQRWLTLAK